MSRLHYRMPYIRREIGHMYVLADCVTDEKDYVRIQALPELKRIIPHHTRVAPSVVRRLFRNLEEILQRNGDNTAFSLRKNTENAVRTVMHNSIGPLPEYSICISMTKAACYENDSEMRKMAARTLVRTIRGALPIGSRM